MKLKDALLALGSRAEGIAKSCASELDIDWEDGIKFVFSAISRDSSLVPNNIGGTRDSAEDLVRKWVGKYDSGYKQRISQRVSKLPGTVADPIICQIIQGKLTHLTESDLSKISFAHRLSMSAENILGLLLEEFLAKELREFNWHCAWGETIRSVDFVKNDGSLLQIKNRSNSENSSSSRVREGTSIQKWHRVDAATGTFMWGELNTRFSTDKFSEDMFMQFVTETVTQNAEALAVEEDNPWLAN